jgi:hypothetical protein
MASGWTDSTVSGELENVDGEALTIRGTTGKTKKVWVGQRYTGPPPPPIGTWAEWQISTAPPKNGRKFGSNYLNSFKIVDRPPSLAAVPDSPAGGESEPRRYVGRDPGMADDWQAMRGMYNLAADLLVVGASKRPSVVEISKLAGELFRASWVDALRAREEREEATKPTAANG